MDLKFLRAVLAESNGRGELRVPPRPPFGVRNEFVLYFGHGQIRGGHAHRRASQLIWPVLGSFLLIAEYKGAECFERHQVACVPDYAVLVEPMTWVTVCRANGPCVCVVWSSEPHDPAEYVTSRDEFAGLAGRAPAVVRQSGDFVWLSDG